MKSVRALAAMAAILAVPVAVPAAAQEPMQPAEPVEDTATLTDPRAAALDAEAAAIAARLRCPVCSGQSVLESNSAIAQGMQEVIRERLEAGHSEDEILAYFRGAYGEWISLRPRPIGWNLVVYVLPALVLIAGGLWLLVVLRRWSGRSGEASGDGEVAAADGHGDSAADTAGPGALSADDEAWLRESIGG